MLTTSTLASPEESFRDDAEAATFDRAALSRHLRSVGIDFDSRQPIRQFAGGLANRNYLVEIDGSLAVLRRPPSGPLPRGSHDMAREHLILSRLSRVLAVVPSSLHYCADPGVIGAPFQIVEYRRGLVLRGASLDHHDADAPERLSRMLIETLASIHAVDPQSCGLGDLGRPHGFIDRAIEGWRVRGLDIAAATADAALIEDVARWLRGIRFAERRPALLHLDFKLDNIILDPDTLLPVAVLDWDMGTRGDPLFDLATLLSYWSQPSDPGALRALDMMPTTLLGFWSRDTAMTRYAAMTGHDLGDLHAMRVLAFLKLGVVFLQLHGQWRTGAVTSARYEAFGGLARDILLHARDLATGRAA